MKSKTYLILLVDRKRALMFILHNGVVGDRVEYSHGDVPQKVKHGDDTWDAQDKIFRHIEDHLHRHLLHVTDLMKEFSKKHRYSAIIIGGHKPLFPKVKKHIPYPFDRKLQGEFVTALKAPFDEILKRAKKTVAAIEEKELREQVAKMREQKP